MTLKKIIARHSSTLAIICVLLLSSLLSTAQTKSERKGDAHLEAMEYEKATNYYLKAFNRDEYNEMLKLKLARCNQLLNKPQETAMWYNMVIENNSITDAGDRFNYAMALLQIGDVEAAKDWFQRCRQDDPTDQRPAKFLEQLKNLDVLERDSILYELRFASFNSPHSDFCPAYFGEDVVFVSTRKNARRNSASNGRDYTDLFITTKNRIGLYKSAVPFLDQYNTVYYEGPLQFYDQQRKLVVTRNNMDGDRLVKSSTGITRLQLHFYALNHAGDWESGEEFSINSKEHSVGHAAISEDGATLYFVSDMPGGFGGTDIYVTNLINSEWTQPENLGQTVNTKGNEMFPYLKDDSTLYFSSNGQGGLGGLDIFECSLPDLEIRNMGMPFNSSRDDFGIVFNKQLDEGFLSSNRASSTGNDNIFHFTRSKSVIREIDAQIIDSETGAAVAEAMITWEEVEGESVAEIPSTLDGNVKLRMKLQCQYRISVRKEGYRESELFIMPETGREKVTLKLNRE